MSKNLKESIPGISVTLLSIISSCILLYIIANTALLTAKIIWLCIALFAIVAVAVFILTISIKRKVRFIIGCVLAALIIVLQIIGGYFLATGAATLSDITKPDVEHAEIGVYVRKKDKAVTIADAKDYNFGIMEILDRGATDIAIEKINGEVGATIKTVSYTDVYSLIDALINTNDIGAIIINKSFLDLLDETDETKASLDKIRELYSVTIENNQSTGLQAPPPDDDTFTVYISGIDCYGHVTRCSRSDVNILATVNTKTGQILLVSTPRDYYVPLSISDGIPDKLTHAGIYGINVSMETLEMLYGIEIDYYFRVNFDGFKDIIDALGGIVAKSNYTFTAVEQSFVKGLNEMDGEKALVFARERYSLPGGDGSRGQHQMEVIKGVVNKLLSSALIKNYSAVLKGVEGSFQTSIPYETIADLVKNPHSLNNNWNLTSYSVGGTGASRKPYSLSMNAYVLIPNEETIAHAKKLMEQVEDGQIPTP